MRTLFQHGSEVPSPGRSGDDERLTPVLLVEWSSWPGDFFRNLRDLALAPFRRQPALPLSSRPSAFWPDVFVDRRMPVAPFRQSALYHLFAVVAIWGFSHTWLSRPRIEPRSPFEHARITYYPTSAYLPALSDEADEEPAKLEKKGEPVHAEQRIRSVPRRPDNTRQTIVTPSPLTIHNDVPLPNIVAWNRSERPAPVAAVTGLRAQLAAPPLAAPIAPPPQTVRTQLPSVALPQPTAIAPPPAVNIASSKPRLAAPGPVPPAPSLRERPLGDLNIAHVLPGTALPRLPVVEQSAAAPIRAIGTRRAVSEPDTTPVSPPSAASIGGMNADGGQSVRQLIALGVHPAAPGGPLQVPDGNRRGTFAAAPEGKPGASGTPDIRGNGQNETGGGADAGARTPLPGVTVEKPPVEMAAVRPAARPSARDVFAQTLARARAPDIPRPRSSPSVNPGPKVEDLGAGPKKYYSLVLNMPNLTSTGGSWIIRFAELKETDDKAPVSAPVPTVKVDPAYPAELLRNHVEGMVMLYAVIHADGSVGAVRVLRSVDTRLDASARDALQKWHFRPGTKNGSAVELEAVVQIPFQARPTY